MGLLLLNTFSFPSSQNPFWQFIFTVPHQWDIFDHLRPLLMKFDILPFPLGQESTFTPLTLLQKESFLLEGYFFVSSPSVLHYDCLLSTLVLLEFELYLVFSICRKT